MRFRRSRASRARKHLTDEVLFGVPVEPVVTTEDLLALPLAERVEKCLELGMRNVPVDQAEKTEYERANTPGLVVYDTPVEPMTHERLAELARPHAPREGEVTPEHIAAWTKEKLS